MATLHLARRSMNTLARTMAVGPWTFTIDRTTGGLRQICHGGHEVLRGVYPAIRDTEWGTPLPRITFSDPELSASGLHLRIDARIEEPEVSFTWRTEVNVSADGGLRYDWTGRATGPLSTRRTGLCVLHPVEVAGFPCKVEHVDGTSEDGWLPTRIAPYQPFRNIRAITHSFAPGAASTVLLEGEVFEMEDQRNWSDASFKTYCRPLDWPSPYTIPAGTEVRQTVTVRIAGQPEPARNPESPVRLASNENSPVFPLLKIGFALREPIPEEIRERVRALKPGFVRVDSHAADLNASFDWAAPEALSLGCDLELAVVGATTRAPPSASLPTGTVLLLFDQDGNAVRPDIIAAWQQRGHTRLGTGTIHNFAELNRARPAVNSGHELTVFGINAQIHAFDDASLLETLTQHGVVAEHARVIGAGRPVAVGPIRLGPQSDSADPRLAEPFAALWTLGSIARLAPVATRATYFDTHGPAGVVRPGAPTPLEQLFLALAGAEKARPVVIARAAPGAIDALLVERRDTCRLLIAHHGEAPLEVEVPWSGAGGTVGDMAATFTAGPLTLPPRSVWQLDFPA